MLTWAWLILLTRKRNRINAYEIWIGIKAAWEIARGYNQKIRKVGRRFEKDSNWNLYTIIENHIFWNRTAEIGKRNW